MLKITAIGNLTNDVELRSQAASAAPPSSAATPAASSTFRGDRNSTSLALMRNPGPGGGHPQERLLFPGHCQ